MSTVDKKLNVTNCSRLSTKNIEQIRFKSTIKFNYKLMSTMKFEQNKIKSTVDIELQIQDNSRQ